MTKVIFFGTPDYVLPILEILYKHFKLVAVVTQPPKLTGRKQMKIFSPVDDWAHKRKIATYLDLSENLPTADLGIVASYGKIIPQSVINHFPKGILNIHPSLLPKYRGASPIQHQIIDGLKETGVTIIKMDAQMDHGPIVSSFKNEIEETDTFPTLRRELFERSAQFLIELLPNYLDNKINLKKQDEADATFTKIIKREEGLVDLVKDNPQEIERKSRALAPWPGIYTFVDLDGKKLRLKILSLHLEGGKLILDKVQLEGKKPVKFDEFKRGYPQMKLDAYRS